MKIDTTDKEQVYRYMGYGGGTVDSAVIQIVDQCSKEMPEVIRPLYTYRIYDIAQESRHISVKGTGLILEGNSIKEHLEGCSKVILMGATISAGADTYIRKQQIKGMIYALAADCIASAFTEQVCDKAEEEIKEKINGRYTTWRFSPGYGDLPITIQKDFLDAIDAGRKIGLTVTKTSILVPRKSVTAIIGLSDKPIPPKRRGCVICNMKDTCQFRKRGEHCGV